MTARLGKNQLRLLMQLADPNRFVVIGDKLVWSLVHRGLLAPHGPDGEGLFQITPNGWRALADAVDRGALEMPEPPKPKQAQRSVC